jgi:hypothetical protein
MDESFTFGGEEFQIKAHTRFLLKNSFKYSRQFFERCASFSGATVMAKTWQEGSIVCFLLQAPPYQPEYIPASTAFYTETSAVA